MAAFQLSSRRAARAEVGSGATVDGVDVVVDVAARAYLGCGHRMPAFARVIMWCLGGEGGGALPETSASGGGDAVRGEHGAGADGVAGGSPGGVSDADMVTGAGGVGDCRVGCGAPWRCRRTGGVSSSMTTGAGTVGGGPSGGRRNGN